MSAFDGVVAVFGGLAIGAVGLELAKTGDLGPGLQGVAQSIDSWIGATAGGATKPSGGTPGSFVSMTGSGDTDTVVIICTDGTQRSNTWATVDSNLKAAGYPGPYDHSQTEATKYAQTCSGAG